MIHILRPICKQPSTEHSTSQNINQSRTAAPSGSMAQSSRTSFQNRFGAGACHSNRAHKKYCLYLCASSTNSQTICVMRHIFESLAARALWAGPKGGVCIVNADADYATHSATTDEHDECKESQYLLFDGCECLLIHTRRTCSYRSRDIGLARPSTRV